MHRKFSISQLSTIISECEAATVRDFLCHLSSSPAENALKNYDQAEKALEPEKAVVAFDQILRVAGEVMAEVEAEKRLAQQEVKDEVPSSEAEKRLAQQETTEEASSSENSEFRFVR